jgi:hypothetical protein
VIKRTFFTVHYEQHSRIWSVLLVRMQERYWEEHPGQAIPMMKPIFYLGPYKVRREDFAEDAPGQ